MKISDIAKHYNISSAALRYYEKIGLMPCIYRKNGVREYGYEGCRQLETILLLKKMNMPLSYIKEYIWSAKTESDVKSKRKSLLIRYKNELDMRISELQAGSERLNKLITTLEST